MVAFTLPPSSAARAQVRLREDERFDAGRALERCDAGAVESIVSNEIDAQLTTAARLSGLLLDATATVLLREGVARAVEVGTPLEKAIEEAMVAWRSEWQQVKSAVERAAAQLGLRLHEAPTHHSPSPCGSASTHDGAATGTGGTRADGNCDQGGVMATLLDQLTLSVAVGLRRGEAVRRCPSVIHTVALRGSHGLHLPSFGNVPSHSRRCPFTGAP